jgi:hypothetical protein
VAKIAMTAVEGSVSWGSLLCTDPYTEAVLKHKKTREIVGEWTKKYVRMFVFSF